MTAEYELRACRVYGPHGLIKGEPKARPQTCSTPESRTPDPTGRDADRPPTGRAICTDAAEIERLHASARVGMSGLSGPTSICPLLLLSEARRRRHIYRHKPDSPTENKQTLDFGLKTPVFRLSGRESEARRVGGQIWKHGC